MKKVVMTIICTVFASTSFAYYQAEQGRWTSRDPINENGGINLYGFVNNNAITYVDYLGQKICCPDGAKPIKSPACIADCKQTYLIDCYSAARIATATSGGFAGGAFQIWNKTGTKVSAGASSVGISGGGKSTVWTSRTRGWAYKRGMGASGRYLTPTGKFMKHVGGRRVGTLAVAWSGVTLSALHTQCLAGYAGCKSGCQKECP